MAELTVPSIYETGRKFTFIDSFESYITPPAKGRWTRNDGVTQTDIVRTGNRALKFANTTQVAYRRFNPLALQNDYTSAAAFLIPSPIASGRPTLLSHVNDFYPGPFNSLLRIRSEVRLTELHNFQLAVIADRLAFEDNAYVFNMPYTFDFGIQNHVAMHSIISHTHIAGLTKVYYTARVYLNEELMYFLDNFEISTNLGIPIDAVFPTVMIGGERFQSNPTGLYVDDFYTCKGDFPGDISFGITTTASDTATADWIPNTGPTGWDRVNQLPVDGDTSHVKATATGARSLYTIVPIDPVDRIYCVQWNKYVEKTAGGGGQFKFLVGDSSQVDNYQSDVDFYPVAAQNRHFHYNLDVNPFTGLEYTTEEFNRILTGIDKVS